MDVKLLHRQGHSLRRIARMTGLSRVTVRRILIGASTESEWVARCVEELGHEVIVADPNYAPMYATRSRRVKTDRLFQHARPTQDVRLQLVQRSLGILAEPRDVLGFKSLPNEDLGRADIAAHGRSPLRSTAGQRDRYALDFKWARVEAERDLYACGCVRSVMGRLALVGSTHRTASVLRAGVRAARSDLWGASAAILPESESLSGRQG